MESCSQSKFTAIKMALSSLITLAIILTYQLDFGYWAVVTVAAITSSSESATLLKGSMRILGTVLGALIGYVIAIYLGHISWLSLVIFFFMLLTTTAFALQPNIFSYAGLMAGVTSVIVIEANLSKTLLMDVSLYRTLAVILGVFIVIIVSLFANFWHKEPWFAQDLKSSIQWKRPPWLSCFRIAVTATLTFVCWIYWQFPGGYWITVSCLIIMEDSLTGTQRKAWISFLAHLIAASVGFVAALLVHQVFVLGLILIISFAICGFVIGLNNAYSSLGNTCAVALSIMLLAGWNHHHMTQEVMARFFNVCAGILIGILATHLINTKPAYSKS